MLNMADEVNSHDNDLENKNIHTNEFIKQRNSSGGEVHEKQRPPPIDVNEASSNSFTGNGGPKTPLPFSTLERKRAERERKIGHRRVDQTGQVTYKKIETSQICGSIQLGIGYAVGSISSKPERDLLMQDFAMVETTSFPKEGSNITPAHHYSDFKFKTYAPVAFRYFRDLFGIQPDDFLLSVCNEPMRELSNPGASGSVFYLTADDEFILKTVQHKEADFLQKLLPGYYMNLNQNKCTLLPKFFGLYCYLCGGKNVRLISMNNILPTSIRMHEKYDLKGSTYKRRASKYEKSKNSPTYKDLDFIEINPEGILLEAETYSALVKTIQRDCRVLESFKIMDYSLLMGIHNLDLAAKEKQEKLRERMATVAKEAAAKARGSCIADTDSDQSDSLDKRSINEAHHNTSANKINLNRSRSIQRQRLAAYSTAMESIQAESEPIDEDDDVPSGGIPARNAKGERLLLFIGIIDILQSYRLKKKLEHSIKAMLTDGDTVSVHRPGFYAQRFQDFMAKTVFKKIPSPLKHSPSKRKGAFARMRPSSTNESNELSKNMEMSQSKTSSVATTATADIKDAASTTLTSSTMTATNTATAASSSITTPTTTTTTASAATESTEVATNNEGVKSFQANFSHLPSLHHQHQNILKSKHNTDSAPCLRTVVIKQAASKQCVNLNDKMDSIRFANNNNKISHHHYYFFAVSPMNLLFSLRFSISQINFQSDSTCSVTSSSSGTSTLRTIAWTPPLSIEGSTPTHTEGTPSLTESSESEYVGSISSSNGVFLKSDH